MILTVNGKMIIKNHTVDGFCTTENLPEFPADLSWIIFNKYWMEWKQLVI